MIKAPKWAANAKADVRGWRDRRTGELLKAQRFTAEQVQEYEDAYAASLLQEEPEFSTGNPEDGFTLEEVADGTALGQFNIVAFGTNADKEIEKDPVAQAVSEVLDNDDGTHIQAPVTAFMELDFDSMTKDELLNLAKEYDIKAYRSWSKDKIIAALT